MISENKMSRRALVSNLGAGVAGAALTAAVPSAAAQAANGPTVAPFVDPTMKYPKPPYPGQSQPWPGLASKMNPRPDHGETSYKGSGRLMGRKALITGGDSGMGRAAAIAYAREGADVVISYYPTEEPDARERQREGDLPEVHVRHGAGRRETRRVHPRFVAWLFIVD